MSSPRPILPGATYLVTRRCTQRQFLLRPSAHTNQVFRYCLAVAAERTGVALHAFVVMSNHWHAVLTDGEARLPEFLQFLHRLVASCMNVSLGRVENFWASEQASVVALETSEDVLDTIAYVIANPTAAGLVEQPGEWPGVITTHLGERRVAERPEVYFRDRGAMPLKARLVCTVPRALRDVAPETLARRLRELVRRNVRRAHSTLRDAGRTFLGAEGVRTISLDRSARTPESPRQRRPTLAAKDRAGRLAAIDRLRAFRRSHRRALTRWRAGDRAALFPEGTYLMRVLHGACCGPEP
jgi:REP element-mobilizing transposase RayT